MSNVCVLQNATLYNSGFDTGLGFVIYKTLPDREAICARKGPAAKGGGARLPLTCSDHPSSTL